MYGQLYNDRVPAAGIAHTLGTANFCAFLIQDRTSGGVALPAQRAYVTAKASTTYQLADNTAGGPSIYDVFLTSPHSIFDVGPIVGMTGAGVSTRTTTPPPGRSGYRSLHQITFQNAIGTPGDDVIITHGMYNAVIAFASPTSDPVDTGNAACMCTVQQLGGGGATTVTLRSRRNDGGNFTASSPVNYDVMVIGVHSQLFPPHRATAVGPNFGNTSYNYSDAAFLARAQPSLLPSYRAIYTNVDGIQLIGGGGIVLEHNLRGTASMAFVMPGTGASLGLSVPYISNRATSSTTMTLAQIGGPTVDNAFVMVIRPYSVVNS